jgi:hypothetical protein
MKGIINKTEKGWVVRYNQRVENKMLGYHDYKTTTLYDELPLHPDDVKQILEDAQVFDNIEARIAKYPKVDFEIRNVVIDDLSGLHAEEVIYAKLIKDNKISRVEVIDEHGRAYVKYFDGECELSYQDDGRTLKIFITPNKK